MANLPALGFYRRLGFKELLRVGEGKGGCIYMGRKLQA
jgi:ribosomal protein S18 acetylase RimI-like enzyme